MSKNKTNTPIVSNKTLLKSYAASMELQQATIEKLKAKLADSEQLYDELLQENKSLLADANREEKR